MPDGGHVSGPVYFLTLEIVLELDVEYPVG